MIDHATHVLERRRQRPVVEVPGHHHRDGDLHQLRWLEPDNAGNLQPALRTFHAHADQQHEDQQHHAQEIDEGRPAQIESGIELGCDQQGNKRQSDAYQLIGENRRILIDRAVEDHQPKADDGTQSQQQQRVQVDTGQVSPGRRSPPGTRQGSNEVLITHRATATSRVGIR